MKTGAKTFTWQGRTLRQVVIAFLLIIFPVLMIVFNSTRALNGIIWQMPSELKPSLAKEQEKNHPESKLRVKAPDFGIYDPTNKFAGNRTFILEQIYFSWIDLNEAFLKTQIKQIYLKERIPIITIEPWNGGNDENTLLSDILTGKYDTNIDRVIKVLAGFSGKLYISWGHEMDQDLTKRYPWSGKEPDQYILAFRYVQDRMKKNLKNEIKWIWSPVVKKGCERYWPGDGYVDFIGMPVYSYPAWDKSYYGHIRSFRSWYDEKYKLVRQFYKPVFIVEFGVTGSQDYQTFWLQEAFEALKTYSSIETVIFFYAKDSKGSWGMNFEAPDWRADPETITGLVDWIKK